MRIQQQPSRFGSGLTVLWLGLMIGCDDGGPPQVPVAPAETGRPLVIGASELETQCQTVSVCIGDICIGVLDRPNGTACSDGDACTVSDTCRAGRCAAGPAMSCDDGNGCTSDSCDPASGCGSTNNTASCDDGDGCTTGDVCADGVCAGTDRVCICGDGVLHPDEECDDDNVEDSDGCTNDCDLARCGDGFVHAGVEECDDGDDDDTDACTSLCAEATCGDGFVQAGEDCDDGDDDQGDACTSLCRAPFCGDGFVQAGEVCDDGDPTADDGCSRRCAPGVCGDGETQLSLGEQCDDGNQAPDDGCDPACHTDPFEMLPPVRVNGALACSTAPANAGRKISVSGSGIIYAAFSCGGDGFIVRSTDRGQSYSAPFRLFTGPIAQIAIGATSNDKVHVAIIHLSGEVRLRTSSDDGDTWGDAALVGVASDAAPGLSLDAFDDRLFLGWRVADGIAVARSLDSGLSFATSVAAMNSSSLDVLFDASSGGLIAAADTPLLRIRTSTDGGATFGPRADPPGAQRFSDWAFSKGMIYVVGVRFSLGDDSVRIYRVPFATPTTSSFVVGLASTGQSQQRTIAAALDGDVFVASRHDDGVIALDRLPFGASALDARRVIAPSGAHPGVAALPGSRGAAMIYDVDGDVWVTIQTY